MELTARLLRGLHTRHGTNKKERWGNMDYGNLGYLHSRDDASGRNDKHADSVWFQMYLILIIHSFHICKSDYSPESISQPLKPIIMVLSQEFLHMQKGKKCEPPDFHIASWGQTRQPSVSCFSSFTINRCPFQSF